jgi:hypothetical protein
MGDFEAKLQQSAMESGGTDGFSGSSVEEGPTALPQTQASELGMKCAVYPKATPNTRSTTVNEIALFEAMYSARALRRLKPDPVPQAVLTKILDAAIRAPSAGNAQAWSFLVVRDREQRAKLGAIYRKASDIASVMYAHRAPPAT